MLSACVKVVQTVGKARWNAVGVYPQRLWISLNIHQDSAENPPFLPVLSDVFAHRNPQSKSSIFYLLHPWLSTLSTQPITITTNLKIKER